MLLNERPFTSISWRSMFKVEGPMPCKFDISVSQYFESCLKLEMPLFSRALLAGAGSDASNPA